MIYSAWTIKDGSIIRYQRTILNEARRSIDKYPVTLITGARQVGKSTLSSYFEEKWCRYITFYDANDTDLLIKSNENSKRRKIKWLYKVI